MKKLILTLAGLGCLLCGFGPALGANAPADAEKRGRDSLRAARLEKVAAFRAVYPDVKIQTNSLTGVVENLSGDLSKHQTQFEPVEAVYEFLVQNKNLYGMTDPRKELKVNRVEKDQYGGMVEVQQLYEGLPVSGGGGRAYFSSSGKLKRLKGVFHLPIDISSTPSIDSLSAIAVASRDLNFKSTKVDSVWWQAMGLVGKTPSASLAILPLGREYHLVWVVKIEMATPPGSWEYFIDASNGKILQRQNHRIVDRRSPSKQVAPEKGPAKSDSLQPSLDKIRESPPTPKKKGSSPQRHIADSSEAPTQTAPKRLETLRLERESKALLGESSELMVEPVEVKLDLPIDSLVLRKFKNKKINNEGFVPQKELISAGSVWETIMDEDFEVEDFPAEGSNWYAVDNNGTANGQYFWDDDTFRAYSGAWSVWCARGGADGLDPRFNNYADSMDSWMVYGPFSLSEATDAEFNFWAWLKSEQNFDYLWWLASNNGSNFYGYRASGNTMGWGSARLALDSVPLLQGGYLNFVGSSNLWIAFRFTSDVNNTDSGAFVDLITLEQNAPLGTQDIICYQPPFWDGPLVVSNQPNTNTQSQIVVGEEAYIDIGFANVGTVSTSAAFESRVFVGDSVVASPRTDPPFQPQTINGIEDIPFTFLSAGTHTVKVVHDYFNTIMESSGANNVCSLVVDVRCAPGYAIGTGVGGHGTRTSARP